MKLFIDEKLRFVDINSVIPWNLYFCKVKDIN